MAWRMSKIMTWCAGVALVGSLAWGGQPMAARAAGAPWGRAIEVPGLGALNKGGDANNQVSCPSAGNCAAGGYYTDSHRTNQGFVADERNGRWGKAIELPGLGALNKGGNAVSGASVSSVSCTAAGYCGAGGFYQDGSRHSQGFVASERHGRWGKAIEVPGLRALSNGRNADVFSLSCASAGDCAAGGFYQDRHGHGQGYVVSESNGRWGKAIEVPGLAALRKGTDARVVSVSCGSAGNCAAGGFYRYGDSHQMGFVVSERNGRWAQAIEVPGLAALNGGRYASVYSVSCASAGNCVAGGTYADRRHYQGFVVDEKNGVWDQAIEVPGLGSLNKGGPLGAHVESVSCASAGNCAAGGTYTTSSSSGYTSGFVVSETHGVWGTAIGVPGLRALSTAGYADVYSVSCATAGNCGAGGDYIDRRRGPEGFVVSETNGVWGTAINVPGLRALDPAGDAAVWSVSCAPAGSCTAAGQYATRRGYPAFVT